MGSPLSEVIGAEIRRIRLENDVTVDSLARAARLAGLGWSRPTLAAIEAGRRGLSFDEVIAMPLIFDEVDVSVSVIDLLGEDGIDLTPLWHASRAGVALLLAGGDWRPEVRVTDEWVEGLRDTAGRMSEQLHDLQALLARHPDLPEGTVSVEFDVAAKEEATQKASRRLQEPSIDIAAASLALWGRSLTQERDARVGDTQDAPEPTVRALRGRATRALLDEMREYFAALP